MINPSPAKLDGPDLEKDLLAFMRAGWHVTQPGTPFKYGYHLDCLCEHLMAWWRGEFKNWVCNLPPRHTKSLAAAVYFFGWAWAQKPESRFIYLSYSQQRAGTDSVWARDVILSPWYQDRWGARFALKDDQNAKTRFANTRQGHRICASPGGGAGTGDGADWIIADDPISVEESFSRARREEVWRHWTQTMSSRFGDPEKIGKLILQQRTAADDPSGRALAEKLGYVHLCLPFEAEPKRFLLPDRDPALPPPKHPITPTPLQLRNLRLADRRAEGDILWPEQFGNPQTVKDFKREIGRGAPGQLQQRPEAEGGTIYRAESFKRFYPRHGAAGLEFVLGAPPAPGEADARRVIPARDCLWYQTIDTAIEAGEENDWTVATTFAKAPTQELLIFHVLRLRLEIPDQWPMIQQARSGQAAWDAAARAWAMPGAARPWPKPLAFQAVEPKASGKGLLQTARLAGLPLRELVGSDQNPMLRAAPAATLYQQGMVYHNAEGEWLADAENELLAFPGGPHDDFATTVAYGCILYVQDSLVRAFAGELALSGPSFEEMAAAASPEGFIPPGRRDAVLAAQAAQAQAPAPAGEGLDAILARLRLERPPARPVTDDAGLIDPRFLEGD
jgi:phage terminase large subunit-like protein